MYADDTSIFLHHNHIDNLYTNAQIEMNLISNWLAANKLTLNVGGTKYEVTWRTERARLNKQIFQWRHSFSEIFILVITVIGLG